MFAVVIRHLLILKRPFEIFNQLYWIFIDILVFGFLTQAMRPEEGFSINTQVLLTKVALWYTVVRCIVGLSATMGRDLTDSCFVSLLASPITISEWLASQMLFGALQSLWSTGLSFFYVKLFFGYNIFTHGYGVFIFIFSLLIAGWWIGLIALITLVLYGKRATVNIYAMAWFFVPISGVFYPISFMPQIVQTFAQGIPLLHIFQAIEVFVRTGTIQAGPLILANALNIIYIGLGIALTVYALAWKRRTGLTQLEAES